MDVVLFLLSFVVILAGCEFFTNGVEWAGKRFNLSEGCVGSVLAAVGTAMPETIIPLIAIIFLGGEAGDEIGVGAILGAPFMLATLALFVCGLSVLVFAKRRKTRTLHINGHLIRRDLTFFLIAYSLAALAALSPPEFWWFKTALGFSLIPLYIVYVWYTVRTGEGCAENGEDLKPLYCDRVAKRCFGRSGKEIDCVGDPVSEGIDSLVRTGEPSTALIIFQTIGSLLLIIIGANLFVEQIREIAEVVNIPALILALIIAPIATELPEKFNSMLWIRAGKDTYAIGNITGAMVFQSCIPVTIGILLTSWHIDLTNQVQFLEAASIGIAIFSGIVLYARSSKTELKMSALMMGGVLYLLFFLLVALSL